MYTCYAAISYPHLCWQVINLQSSGTLVASGYADVSNFHAWAHQTLPELKTLQYLVYYIYFFLIFTEKSQFNFYLFKSIFFSLTWRLISLTWHQLCVNRIWPKYIINLFKLTNSDDLFTFEMNFPHKFCVAQQNFVTLATYKAPLEWILNRLEIIFSVVRCNTRFVKKKKKFGYDNKCEKEAEQTDVV